MKEKILYILLGITALVGCVLGSWLIFREPKSKIIEEQPNNLEVENEKNFNKIDLKLGHEVEWDELYGLFGTEAETIDVEVKIKNNINLHETKLKKYEENKELAFLKEFIYKNLNLTLDNKWKYTINIWNDEDNIGNISFIYYIDENISTNRAIQFFFDNGIIYKMSYSYLDSLIDENIIKNNVKKFNENTTQEKKVLAENETYLEERTHFVYNYRINKTTYSYVLFFVNNDGTINNDYGSEYIIEDFLKENNLN